MQFLADKLEGEILINLGGGQEYRYRRSDEKLNNRSPLENFTEKIKPKAIINVDVFAARGNVDLRRSVRSERRNNTVIMTVAADMLDFLQHLPDESVSIQIDGINESLISKPEYHQALAKEIERVVQPNGIILAVGSDSVGMIDDKVDREGAAFHNRDDLLSHSRRQSKGLYLLEKGSTKSPDA